MLRNHFRGHTLLGEMEDSNRGRTVRAYLIKDRTDIVGVSDGVDSWIAGPHSCLYSLNLPEVIAAISRGEAIVPKLVSPKAKRLRHSLSDDPPSTALRTRHRLDDVTVEPRRRVRL